MRPLGIDGAWVLEPKIHPDERGSFHEWFRGAEFREATGHDLDLKQANFSVSKRGTIRGIHYADVPPGQSKYVKCGRGALLDVVIDLRVGSPTFGRWEAVRLDDETHHAVYLAEGLGHAFMALEDDTVAIYLTSEGYAPDREHGLNPLDAGVGIEWPAGVEPLLSEKDTAAPGLAEAQAQGLLPSYDVCQEYYASLRSR
ncbi:dTDP-4-dehydrorhamnose 3,5-epimerase [Mangrovactinospora gilvigrisea]|uniref:dTDP-4-dehydrorhamnose 3,5-epimerase n=1 Tax=Mangrovactinospora gilvigrisea TaxID=1428644 RepID=A0A1J7BF59_9ACTN|nr:dTDP-4-dehydrorhamnose 3,5-epimerase [Mangrovactinospora gilvigrisea]OIV37323.1 dTDP-4-dehydrorhamnose 3,5-epimerase [Mangrovactinospora gilvigrisea]